MAAQTTKKIVADILAEYMRYNESHSWYELFQTLESDWNKRFQRSRLTTHVANESKNFSLNRYANVVPYDQTRVVLTTGENNYINASWISTQTSAPINRQYILTQGPTSKTNQDFWRMVYENDCKVILMLNNFFENGKEKCSRYFPLDEGSSETFGQFKITVNKVIDPKGAMTERHMQLSDLTLVSKGAKPKTIYHFHLKVWPDYGAPPLEEYLKFTKRLQSGSFLHCDVNGPTVVHCSAGVGRSGVFVVADTIIAMRERQCLTRNVLDQVVQMRCSRMGLIQSAAQLKFTYIAILEDLQPPGYEREIKTDSYQNDVDGRPRKEEEEEDSSTIVLNPADKTQMEAAPHPTDIIRSASSNASRKNAI